MPVYSPILLAALALQQPSSAWSINNQGSSTRCTAALYVPDQANDSWKVSLGLELPVFGKLAILRPLEESSRLFNAPGAAQSAEFYSMSDQLIGAYHIETEDRFAKASDKSTLSVTVFDPDTRNLSSQGKTGEARKANGRFLKRFRSDLSRTQYVKLKSGRPGATRSSVVETFRIPHSGKVMASLKECAVTISRFGNPDYEKVIKVEG